MLLYCVMGECVLCNVMFVVRDFCWVRLGYMEKVVVECLIERSLVRVRMIFVYIFFCECLKNYEIFESYTIMHFFIRDLY